MRVLADLDFMSGREDLLENEKQTGMESVTRETCMTSGTSFNNVMQLVRSKLNKFLIIEKYEHNEPVYYLPWLTKYFCR